MTNDIRELYEQYCLKLIASSLAGTVGKPVNVLTDDELYRQHVSDAAWKFLPAPLRVVGRDKLRWEEFFQGLREEVFFVEAGKVALRRDSNQRLTAQLDALFPIPDAAPVPDEETAAEESPAPRAPAPRHRREGEAPAEPPAQARQEPRPPRSAPRPAAKFAPKPGKSPSPPAAASKAPAREIVQLPVPPEAGAEAGDAGVIAVGIDLGTTFSVVAHLDEGGRPVSIPNAAGDLLTPSVVLFEEGGAIVGKEAVLGAAMEPERVAECVKRDMGSKAYRKKINGDYIPPEVISAVILRSLKTDAERKLGPVGKAVITVPAYFDEGRRRATMDAGRLAELEVLDIINEPTAAAIAFGYQLGFLDPTGQLPADRPIKILVYDLGGGTFDVTILEIHGTAFKALATDGDVSLGGKDWDEKLVEMAAE
jgi:Ethanolamine utilization protein EutJ (predicted chaperonin)